MKGPIRRRLSAAVTHLYDRWRLAWAYSRLISRSDRHLADMGLEREGLKARLWADIRRRREAGHADQPLPIPAFGGTEGLGLRATNQSRRPSRPQAAAR